MVPGDCWAIAGGRRAGDGGLGLEGVPTPERVPVTHVDNKTYYSCKTDYNIHFKFPRKLVCRKALGDK